MTPIISTPGTTGIIYLAKSCTPNTDVGLGQTIHYTYEVINQGTGPVSSISLTDSPMPEFGIDCSGISDPLAGGGQASCTSSHVTTQPDMDAGSLTNTATANAQSGGGPVQPATSGCTVDFDSRAELTLTKSGTAPATIVAGQLVTYVFTLRNTGTVRLWSPYAISDARIGANWTCGSAVSPLAPGASTTCTGTYALTNGDITARSVTNTATATAKYGTPTPTLTVTSNQASTTVSVPQLLLQMSAAPASVSALGQTITYTYTLTNQTNSSMTTLRVNDSRGASNYNCGSTLAAHATTICTPRTSTSYTQADMDAGVITNQATATSASPAVTSNSATTSVSVTQTAAVQLIKTASPSAPTSPATTFTLPQNITYTYTLKNIGNVTLSAPYTVTDDKIASVDCSGATGTIAPNATKACTNAIYPLTQADLNAGSVINHASGSAMRGGSNIISAQTSATVITYTLPRLTLVKSSNPTFFTTVGNQITYSYSLKNTGGVLNHPELAVHADRQRRWVDHLPGWNDPGPGCVCELQTTPTHAVSVGRGNGRGRDQQCPSERRGNDAVCTHAIRNPAGSRSFPAPPACCGTQTRPPSRRDRTFSGQSPTIPGRRCTSATSLINWNAAPPTLNQVLLGGTVIWNGPPSSSSGGFFLPNPGWTLPNGADTVMELQILGLRFQHPHQAVIQRDPVWRGWIRT